MTVGVMTLPSKAANFAQKSTARLQFSSLQVSKSSIPKPCPKLFISWDKLAVSPFFIPEQNRSIG